MIASDSAPLVEPAVCTQLTIFRQRLLKCHQPFGRASRQHFTRRFGKRREASCRQWPSPVQRRSRCLWLQGDRRMRSRVVRRDASIDAAGLAQEPLASRRAVPELTRNADIKLNQRVSLRANRTAISSAMKQSWPKSMNAERNSCRVIDTSPPPAWAEVWHLWRVVIPRRSIVGRLVFGQVWRRREGRHWIYKKFTEYEQDRA